MLFTTDGSVAREGFNIAYTVSGFDCTGTATPLTGESGVIGSPGYPAAVYSPLLDCTWTIQTSVPLTFVSREFDLEAW